jgi:hypothetical protein
MRGKTSRQDQFRNRAALTLSLIAPPVKVGWLLALCGRSQTAALPRVMVDHRRMIPMAQHIMPFTFGVIGPLILVSWLILH